MRLTAGLGRSMCAYETLPPIGDGFMIVCTRIMSSVVRTRTGVRARRARCEHNAFLAGVTAVGDIGF